MSINIDVNHTTKTKDRWWQAYRVSEVRIMKLIYTLRSKEEVNFAGETMGISQVGKQDNGKTSTIKI